MRSTWLRDWSRLRRRARVLVGAETVALAGVAAAVEALEPLELKGKSGAGGRIPTASRIGPTAERAHSGRFRWAEQTSWRCFAAPGARAAGQGPV